MKGKRVGLYEGKLYMKGKGEGLFMKGKGKNTVRREKGRMA
jgi:hypothetical protein